MFTPKWKKEAKHLYKGSKKFIHYKRDLIEEGRVDEIESRRKDLKVAWKAGDKDETKEAGKLLQACCEQSLPRYRGPDALTENVEVFFVAIVIALGLRAYYLQPFRIPTGSMRPTLNGIIGHVEPKENWPALPVRMLQEATHGRSYHSIVNETEGDRIIGVTKGQVYHFFSRTYVKFSSGRTVSLSGSETSFYESLNIPALEEAGKTKLDTENIANLAQQLSRISLPKGLIVAEGYVETGDLVLVDKFSYHFRKPTPGEVFVFDTRDIKYIHDQARQSNTVAGSHYIKRLIGTPGDTIELRSGANKLIPQRAPDGSIVPYQVADHALLYRNGEKMQEEGVLKVESLTDAYGGYLATAKLAPGRKVVLKDEPSTGMSEYWAMGDNSYNSSDSRMFGTVKEFNVIGPALFTLWPFGSGHWGLIN